MRIKIEQLNKESIINDYLTNRNIFIVAKKYNVSVSTINKILKQNNINIIGVRKYSIGNTIGDLKIIDIQKDELYRLRKIFVCQCKCGKIIKIPQKYFYGNKKINCGCQSYYQEKLDCKEKYIDQSFYKKLFNVKLINSIDSNYSFSENEMIYVNMIKNKKYVKLQDLIDKERKKILTIKNKEKRNKNKITKKIQKIIDAGILPQNIESLSEEQIIIYNEIIKTNIPTFLLIEKYINLANVQTKQKYIFKKILHKKNQIRCASISDDLKPEDIIINEYCPFFNTKIDYCSSNKKSKLDKYHYSVDRIDNSKGYVKGTVWVISMLANAIKNYSTILELLVFSENIIKFILDKQKV